MRQIGLVLIAVMLLNLGAWAKAKASDPKQGPLSVDAHRREAKSHNPHHHHQSSHEHHHHHHHTAA